MPYRPPTEEDLVQMCVFKEMWEIDAALAVNHHADGHVTEQEACDCYKKYLLDRHLRLNRSDDDAMYRCRVCGEMTHNYAAIPVVMRQWPLCSTHNTRDEVEKLFQVERSWRS